MLARPLSLALAAAVFAAPWCAAAASGSLALEPAPYHLSFDGHLWNGEHKVYDHRFSFTPTTGNQLHASVTKQETGEHAEFSVVRGADGSVTSSDPDERFSAYNTIASIASSAPAALVQGQAWDSHITVDLGDHVTVSVPVHSWVATIGDGHTIVDGTGTLATTVTYSGFVVPIELSLRLVSDFDGGTFARAKSSASEVIHAGPQTQTLDWTWSLERD